MPMDKSRYPVNWDEISLRIREKAQWKCEQCGVAHDAIIARDAAQATLDEAQSALEEYESLLHNARLDEFWERVGGLRLAIGDELAVTPKAVTWMKNQAAITRRRLYWRSEHPEIHAVYIDSQIVAVRHDNLISPVPVALAQAMRQAFLDEYFPEGA